MVSRVAQAMNARSLAYAYAAVFGAITLVVLLVAMFGRDGVPVVRVDLPPVQHPESHAAAKPIAPNAKTTTPSALRAAVSR